MTDVSPTLAANSDQLTADDLIGGPITVQILGVHVTPGKPKKGEQPVSIRITGHQPWKPCLTMRRVLTGIWGPDGSAWVGRTVRLYRDPSVRSPDGTPNVGGIRLSHASDIDGPQNVVVTVTRGKKAPWRVMPLTAQIAPRPDLAQVLAEAELTEADLDRWRAADGKPAVSTLTDEQRGHIAGWLAADPTRLDAIRALIPLEQS